MIGKGFKRTRGRLTISKPTTTSGKQYVQIEVTDAESVNRIVEIEVPLKVFAEALFSHAYRPCKIKIYKEGVKRMGKTLETKVVELEIVKPMGCHTVVPHDRETIGGDFAGWFAVREQWNHHHVVKSLGGDRYIYRVTCRRWVKKTKEKK